MNATTKYFYRKRDDRAWQPLSAVATDAVGLTSGFEPLAVDPALNVAYGFDDLEGRSALFRIALDGSLKREVVLSRPDVDVDQLVRIGRQQRVVGAAYTTDRTEAVYFDPELKSLHDALLRALPGDKTISFIDATADEKQLIVFAGGDADPGTYYLFEKATKHLALLLPARPQLHDVRLASVKSITYKATDGTVIPAYLTLPPGSDGRHLPAIVMPHGGPGDRDTWGFDWWAQYFANRGFAVLQPEFRGSTGYGAQWYQKNGFQSWRTAIGDVVDAGRYLLSSGIAERDKLAVVGWSYGGYAALQSAVTAPDLFKAVIAVAPVTDLEMLRSESRGFTNFAQTDRFIGHGKHIEEGSPAQNAAAINAPVLMFHGDKDQNVGVAESRLMERKLRGVGKQVDYVEFKGLDHQLLDDDARADMLDRSDRFLRTALRLVSKS
ncbi:alpha/beta hydrolase family protein [Sphingomonas oligophenolica]|nr:alpha/beta fold hydrolase [Sphingomonas oligophenolica]